MSIHDYLATLKRLRPSRAVRQAARSGRTGQPQAYQADIPGTMSHTLRGQPVGSRRAVVIDRNAARTWSPYEDPVTVNGFSLPHVATFSGIMSSAARVYSWRWDEAYKTSRFNAVAMRRDCFLMGLMDERKLATAQLNWHLEPEVKTDPYQAGVAAHLTEVIKAIPNLHRIFMALLEAIWYGRYAVQLSWDFDNVSGRRVLMPVGNSPINGDKIQFDWTGVPAVLVQSAYASQLPDKHLIHTDRTTALRLGEDFWRRRFIIHKHLTLDEADFFEPEMAGAVHGLGVRHFIYWMNWVRNEYIADVMDFMKRVGLGLTVLYYEAGNPQSERKAIEAGENIGDRAVIAWPRPIGSERQGAGIDRMEVPVSGAGLLVELQRHLEDHIERYIVGQMMSGGKDSGGSGWGSKKAEFAQDTKYRKTKSDADNLSETLTADLVTPLKLWNYPDSNFRLRFVFDVDSPDPAARMEAAKWLHDMDVPLDGQELREVGGFSAPKPGSEVILGATSAAMKSGLALASAKLGAPDQAGPSSGNRSGQAKQHARVPERTRPAGLANRRLLARAG